MPCDVAAADEDRQSIWPPLPIDEDGPILPPPIPLPAARPSPTSAGQLQSSGRRHRWRIWRSHRLTRPSSAYLYHPKDDDYEIAFPRTASPSKGGDDGGRGGGPAFTPAWLCSSQTVAGAITSTRASEPTDRASEPRKDRPTSSIGRPADRSRLAEAAMAASEAGTSPDAATPRGEKLPAWVVIQRGQATAQFELDVQLVVPLRWTAAGRLVVRPPLEKGRRANGEEEVVPPERVVFMGHPNTQPGGRTVLFASAAPREMPQPPERLESAQPRRQTASDGGIATYPRQTGIQCHCEGVTRRHACAASARGSFPLLREQHSEPLVASSATRAWAAASHETGRAIASASKRSPTPPTARGTQLRKVSGEPQEQQTGEEDPTLEWQTTGLFPTLSPGAAGVTLVRVDTESFPSPQASKDDRGCPDRWPLSRPPADIPPRCVVSFSTPLPVAGLPSEVAFSFLGVLLPSVSTVGGVTSLRLEWATLRFAAAVIDGGTTGDRGSRSRGSAAAAVVDMVDFGVRLQDAAAVAAGWVVSEVEPRPGCDAAFLTTSAPDVSVAAGPSGVSISRGGGSFVESVRAPYAVAATVGTHGIIAHNADWRWELKGNDDGSPYYAHRGRRRVPVGRWRHIVTAAAAPAAATQSHTSPAGALHASWTAPAAGVAAAPTLTFEVYLRPRVVRWPREGLRTSVRLALSRSEPRLSSGIEYTQAFTFSVPVE